MRIGAGVCIAPARIMPESRRRWSSPYALSCGANDSCLGVAPCRSFCLWRRCAGTGVSCGADDKLSLPSTIILAMLFLGEFMTWRLGVGVVSMTAGAILTIG